MTDGFLDKVYEVRTTEDSLELYRQWSETYDNEMEVNGYVTPRRCAQALADFVEDLDPPVLDFGCGTGRSGAQLVEVGFRTIDGCDISAEMMAIAQGIGVYRRLIALDPDAPLPFEIGDYQHITAVGVISLGAAPASTLDQLLALLPAGGTLTFSFNEHTMQSPEYTARISEYVDTSAVELLFKESGEHLPGINLESTVFVMRKR